MKTAILAASPPQPWYVSMKNLGPYLSWWMPATEFIQVKQMLRSDEFWQKNDEARTTLLKEIASTRLGAFAVVLENGANLKVVPKEFRSDPDVVMAAISANDSSSATIAFSYIDEVLKEDREFVLAALEKNSALIEGISSDLQKEYEVGLRCCCRDFFRLPEASRYHPYLAKCAILSATMQSGIFDDETNCLLDRISVGLLEQREFLLTALACDRFAIMHLNKNSLYLNDRELYMMSVSSFPGMLSRAPAQIRYDQEFLEIAIECCRSDEVFDFIEEILQNRENDSVQYHALRIALTCNADFVLKLIHKFPDTIRSIHHVLELNHTFLCRAFDTNPEVFVHLPAFVKADRNLVVKALRTDVLRSINYVPPNLWEKPADRLLLLRASVKGLKHYHARFGDIFAVSQMQPIYNYIGSLGRHDALRFVSEDGYLIMHLRPELQNDYELIYSAISENGATIKYATPELRDDFNMALVAVRSNGAALEHVSPRLQANRTIVLTAATNCGVSVRHAVSWLRDDSAIALLAVTQDSEALRFLSPRLKANRAIVLTAVSKCGMSLKHADPDLIEQDKDIALVALINETKAITYLPVSILRDNPDLIAAASAAVRYRATTRYKQIIKKTQRKL